MKRDSHPGQEHWEVPWRTLVGEIVPWWTGLARGGSKQRGHGQKACQGESGKWYERGKWRERERERRKGKMDV